MGGECESGRVIGSGKQSNPFRYLFALYLLSALSGLLEAAFSSFRARAACQLVRIPDAAQQFA
jgi:hypothetical protein